MISRSARLGAVSVAALISCVTFAPNAHAYRTSVTVEKCLTGKLKAVGKSAAAYAGCHAKNTAKPNATTFSACLTKASAKLTKAFTKLDGKYPGCTGGTSDASARAADAAAYTADLNADTGSAVGKCDGAKQQCVGKYVSAILACYAKAGAKTGTVDNSVPKGCTTKSRAKLADGAKGCLDKAAAQTDCTNAGSQEAVLGGAADAFIEMEACRLDPGNGPCPVATPTVTVTATPTATATPTRTATSTPAGPTPTVTGPTPTPTRTATATPTATRTATATATSTRTATATPTATRTATATATPTRTATPTPTRTATPTPTATVTPGGGACPSTIEFAPNASAAASELDWGWTGFTHNEPWVTGGTLTVAVVGPSGPDCLFAGPIANPAGTLANRRCTGGTATQCTSNADCTVAGGTCEFFWGPPHPLSSSGLGFCFTDRIVGGSALGSVNPTTGAVTRALSISRTLYFGPSGSQPCATCVGDPTPNDGIQSGICSGGTRSGLACDSNGSSPIGDFGKTSLDCPLSVTFGVAQLNVSGSTGVESLTLSASSPTCTLSTLPPGTRCGCDTCNNINAEPCEVNADCPLSGGNPGICGGRRCLAGSKVGVPCAVNSECPSSSCSRPGEPTQPNPCSDRTCVDTAPVGDHNGECTAGPTFSHCAAPEQYRSCFSGSDCPTTATCVTTNRECYLDNGTIGGSISAAGAASVPAGGTASPTIANVFCYPPTTNLTINATAGLPGPSRLKLIETMKLHP